MIRIFMRHKKLASGKYPIVLSITKDKKTKIFSLGISSEKKQWTGKKFNRRHPDYIALNEAINNQERKAETIVQNYRLNGEDFTLREFEIKFRAKEQKKVSLRSFWEKDIENLGKAGRIGTSDVSQSTFNSFFNFERDWKLTFEELTSAKLYDYETFLRSNGNQDSGIGIKMRTIRALFNLAIKRNIVDESKYPFKSYKISRLKGKSLKRALKKEEITKIKDFNPSQYPELLDAKNYFIFSYYTGGMNFYDMMKLQWSNIDGDRIHYVRSKTKGRFSIQVLEPVKRILDYYKSRQGNTSYIFPILLKENLTPSQTQNRRKKVLKQYNSKLKKIAALVGIDKPITSYYARHSMATNLKHNGVSTDIIGQAMGHQDIKVTQSYLMEFDDDVIDNAMKKLLEEPEVKYFKDEVEEIIA